MKRQKLHSLLLTICLAAFSLPFVTVHGAGGRVEGKVIDPKGAVVAGAKVTVTDPATNQSFNATTDAEYEVARGEVRALGLDPDAVPHASPRSR